MLQYRGSIALATVVVALFSSRSADAQVAGPPRQPGGVVADVITGVEYDRVNEVAALHLLPHAEAKYQRAVERGHVAAADRHARRIDNLKFRIAVDEWLIRKNSLMEPGYPPIRRTDALSCAAIAQAARPPDYPLPPHLRQISGAASFGPLPYYVTSPAR